MRGGIWSSFWISLSGLVKHAVGYTSLEFKRVIWAGDENVGVTGISVFKFKVMRLFEVNKGVCACREMEQGLSSGACHTGEKRRNPHQESEEQRSER